MLTKTMDVLDGLVNGVCGTVTDTVTSGNDFSKAVYVAFDDEHVGYEQRQQTAHVMAGPRTSTAISPEEDTVITNGGLCKQFPLKPAQAGTP